MSDTRSSRRADDLPPGARPVDSLPSAWTAWITFGAVMMFLLGMFQAIAGLVAIFDEDFYPAPPSQLLLVTDYTVWGWIHLTLGVVVFVTAIGVFSGRALARAVGVVLAALSVLVNLSFVQAQPVWSVIQVTLAVVIVYALIVHGHEMENRVR